MTARLSEEQIGLRLTAARAVAKEAGELAQSLRKDLSREALGIRAKGPRDFVTEADHKVEELIRERLLSRFPADGFFGEESGWVESNGPFWVVDPIDGTSNYISGLRHWAVSIALVDNRQVVCGIVHDATHHDTYSAQLGHGAFCEERRIQAHSKFTNSEAVIILGISDRTEFEDYLTMLRNLNIAGAEHRRLGSAALGLARVAEGAADGYFEASLNSWDALAGLLIATESGADAIFPPISTFLNTPGPVFCGSKDAITLLKECTARHDTPSTPRDHQTTEGS